VSRGICDSSVVPRMTLFESGFQTGPPSLVSAVNLNPSPLPGFTCRAPVSVLSVLIKTRFPYAACNCPDSSTPMAKPPLSLRWQ